MTDADLTKAGTLVHAAGCPKASTDEWHVGPCTQQEGYVAPRPFPAPGVYGPVDVDSWSVQSLTPFTQQMDADIALLAALRPCCDTPPEAGHHDRCPEEQVRRQQAAEDAAMPPVEGGQPIPTHEWHKISHEGEEAIDPPPPLEPAEVVSHQGDDVIFHAVAETSEVAGMPDFVQLQSEPTEVPLPEELPERILRPAKPEVDLVNHPPHYKRGGLEVIDIIEAFDLGFHLGNVVKYILRADAKGATLQDLEKARWYLDREIGNVIEKETRS